MPRDGGYGDMYRDMMDGYIQGHGPGAGAGTSHLSDTDLNSPSGLNVLGTVRQASMYWELSVRPQSTGPCTSSQSSVHASRISVSVSVNEWGMEPGHVRSHNIMLLKFYRNALERPSLGRSV